MDKIRSVVIGVIEDRGRYLLTKRAKGTYLAGKWDFAGGKIEDQESIEDALRREILEETGLEIYILGLIKEAWVRFDRSLTRIFFNAVSN